MDKAFSTFLKVFGDPIDKCEVPLSSVDRYRGKLPDLLLEYWVEFGWAGYGEGMFWLVNPQDYEGVVSSWVENTEMGKRDIYHLVARSAFGDLYLWGEKTGFSLKIVSAVSRCVINDFVPVREKMNRKVQDFFVSRTLHADDLDGLFKPAKKGLGALRRDEMYGFVPALMLGGEISIKNLEKVKAIEHLIFLSQLAELEPYDF